MDTQDVLIKELQKEISGLRFRIEALESENEEIVKLQTAALKVVRATNQRITTVEKGMMKLLSLIEVLKVHNMGRIK